ncbi:hypothetical protein JCM6882_000506 [Rhodosporidiobolus microsporus]
MLDRLPVELLAHLLRVAAPLVWPEEEDGERRRLLSSLCLVCRRVRDVAQPMLPEVFAVDQERHVARFSEGDPPRGQLVKTLVLHEFYDMPWPVEATLGACKNVVDLRLFFLMEFDLGLLADLKNLRHLTTMYTNPTCPPNLVLPNLVSVALAGRTLQISFLEAFLTSTRLPSLRSLSIELSSGDSREYGTRKLPPLPLSLLQQLDDLVVDASDIPLADLPSLEPAPVLVDCYSSQLNALCSDPAPFPSAIRLYGLEQLPYASAADFQGSGLSGVHRALDSLAARLAPAETSKKPRAVLLPQALRPDGEPLYHLVEKTMTGIIDACGRGGVEVLWEPSRDRQIESRLSSVFREWVLRERRKE